MICSIFSHYTFSMHRQWSSILAWLSGWHCKHIPPCNHVCQLCKCAPLCSTVEHNFINTPNTWLRVYHNLLRLELTQTAKLQKINAHFLPHFRRASLRPSDPPTRLPNQLTILSDDNGSQDEDGDGDGDDIVVLTAPAKLGHNKLEEKGRRGRSLP